MNEKELIKTVLELCEEAQKKVTDKRMAVIKEQAFARQHKFEMEAKALSYKDDIWAEADFILFELKNRIAELMNNIPE